MAEHGGSVLRKSVNRAMRLLRLIDARCFSAKIILSRFFRPGALVLHRKVNREEGISCLIFPWNLGQQKN